MSFSFGANTGGDNKPKSSGFSFGTSNNPATGTSASPGFSFGSTAIGSSTPADPNKTAGFSFGSTPGGTTSLGSTGATTGFSFGATNSKPAESSGGSSGGFSFGAKPANQGTGGPAVGTGFSFGGGAVSPSRSAKPPASGGGFPFGSGAAAAAPTQPALTTNKLAGGFSFGTPDSKLGDVKSILVQGSVSPASTTGFNFGAAAGEQKKSEPTAGISGGGGFSFGAKSSGEAQPGPSTSKLATSSFSFGAKKPEEKVATAASSGGGFSFGAKTDDAKAAQPAALGAGGTSSGFSFGAKPAENKVGDAEKTSASKLASSSGFSFGAGAGAASTKPVETGSSAAKPAGKFSFGGGAASKPASSAATTTANTGAAITATASSSTSLDKTITFNELESKINKWTSELGHQEEVFLNQATKINACGLLVNRNIDNLTCLDKSVKEVEKKQKEIDREMDLLVSMQNELAEMIEPLEANVDKQLELNKQNNLSIDSDRERMINLTDTLDQQMFDCSDDLKAIIDQINNRNIENRQSDSISKVTAILSNHIDTLNWIGGQTESLDSKLEELHRNISVLTKFDKQLGN